VRPAFRAGRTRRSPVIAGHRPGGCAAVRRSPAPPGRGTLRAGPQRPDSQAS